MLDFPGVRSGDDVIALAVRWCLRQGLSYADEAEWLAERGISVDPRTIYDGSLRDHGRVVRKRA